MISIALDFDGVLHADMQGTGTWYVISEGPTPGAMEKLNELVRCDQIETIYIFSLRCGNQQGIDAMAKWINEEYLKIYPMPLEEFRRLFFKVGFTFNKPHVNIYIDDKAMNFNGDWSDPQYSLESLLNFKPWNRK